MSFVDVELWLIVWLSLRVSGTAVCIAALMGIPCGVWLGLSRHGGHRWWTALIHTGMALPPVVIGLVLYIMLSRSGPLAFLGWLFTPEAVILAQTLLTLPYVVGIYGCWQGSSLPTPGNSALTTDH